MGKTPIWFKQLREKITTPDATENEYTINIKLPTNPLNRSKIPKKDAKYIATKIGEQTIIGKIDKRHKYTSTIHAKHYTQITADSPIAQCPGCDINVGSEEKECKVRIRRSTCIEVPVAISEQSSKTTNAIIGKHKRLRMSPNTINSEIQKIQTQGKKQVQPQENQNTQDKQTDTLDRVISTSNSKKRQLEDVKEKIKDWKEITIHTDGSLDRNENNTKMGIGIVIDNTQTKERITIKGRTKNWPSSTTAESVAIATALSVVDTKANVNIATDSQTTLNNIFKRKTDKYELKSAATNTIEYIKETMERRIGRTNWTKVKSHSGIVQNDLADKLAKEGADEREEDSINIDAKQLHNTYITLAWGKYQVNTNINEFLREMKRNAWNSKWVTQNRNREWINTPLAKEIDWAATWKSWVPGKITSSNTSFEDHNQRKRAYRLMNSELPTMSKLHERNPEIYRDNKCINCGEKEDIYHIITNHYSNEDIYDRYIKTVTHEIVKRKEENAPKKDIEAWTRKQFVATEYNKQMICKGVFHKEITKIIKLQTGKNWIKTCRGITKKIQEEINKIWRQRCSEMQIWERSVKITNKDKRKGSKGKTKRRKVTNNLQEKNIWAEYTWHKNMIRYIENGTHFFENHVYISLTPPV
jgi:ribonuclease HI